MSAHPEIDLTMARLRTTVLARSLVEQIDEAGVLMPSLAAADTLGRLRAALLDESAAFDAYQRKYPPLPDETTPPSDPATRTDHP